MAIYKIVGACNNGGGKNVFKVTFQGAPLTAPPVLEAWDDVSMTSTSNEIFTGTVGNAFQPMVAAIDTSDTISAPGAGWVDSIVPGAGSQSSNLLKGNDQTVVLDGGTGRVPAANEYVLFNLNLRIPSDTSVPSNGALDCVFVVRYYYSDNTPVIEWAANNGGTDTVPSWTAINTGTEVLRFTDTGVNSSNLTLTLPVSGTKDSGEAWIDNA